MFRTHRRTDRQTDRRRQEQYLLAAQLNVASVCFRRSDGDDEACAYRDAISVHDLTPVELVSLWRRLRLLESLDSQCADRHPRRLEEDHRDNDEELYSDVSLP